MNLQPMRMQRKVDTAVRSTFCYVNFYRKITNAIDKECKHAREHKNNPVKIVSSVKNQGRKSEDPAGLKVRAPRQHAGTC